MLFNKPFNRAEGAEHNSPARRRDDSPRAPVGHNIPSAFLLTPAPGETRGRIACIERPEMGVVPSGAVVLRNPWIREAKLVERVVTESGARQISNHAREVEDGWEQLGGSVLVQPDAHRLEIYLETRTAQPRTGG